MNESQFKSAADMPAPLAKLWYPHISAAMTEFRIVKPDDVAMFIAQIGHESAGFTTLVESLNYSVEGLTKTFGTARITGQQAAAIGRAPGRPSNQQAIANLVYGGEWGRKNLGNTQTGDGWRFRGRGLKQITGRDNYLAAGRALGVDLVGNSFLLEGHDLAARSAAWFFTSKGCLNFSGNVERVTRIINGGLNGLDDRKARYNKARAVLTA